MLWRAHLICVPFLLPHLFPSLDHSFAQPTFYLPRMYVHPQAFKSTMRIRKYSLRLSLTLAYFIEYNNLHTHIFSCHIYVHIYITYVMLYKTMQI